MSGPWDVLLAVAVVTFLLRAAGPALLGDRSLPPVLANLGELLAPSLLAALVVTQVFASGSAFVLDERALGLPVAGLAVCARLPLPLALVLAASATAAARLV